MKKVICSVLIALLFTAALSAQQKTAFADSPAVLTSVGQSADIEMVRVLMTRSQIPMRLDALVKAGDLTSGDRTLVLVVGGSSKGLGAAGISVQDEMRRAQALVTQAKTMGMTIISVHIGGEARRGSLSDDFIRFAVPVSDFVVVVSEGDNDKLFTNLATEAKIPIMKVDRISAAGQPLAAAFK